MNVTEGDLIKFALDARFDVIIHGCNCRCVMGAGIAKIIKQTSELTLHCAPRHDFGARVIPDASAPVIDPRTKPASLPSRRNEFGVRHFSPPFLSHPIGRQPRYPCTAMGPRAQCARPP
jgi:O-acetyl-ADP-ribose deacetylase (regulator of RNase III)